MTTHETTMPSWPETLRDAAQRTGNTLRAIWVGIDTWSAVTHGRAAARPRVEPLGDTRH